MRPKSRSTSQRIHWNLVSKKWIRLKFPGEEIREFGILGVSPSTKRGRTL